jgi:dolichol-phosphate mannosyltransferase
MPPAGNPTLSIIAPVYNEEGNLHELYRQLSGAMEALDGTWELILVDDGSRDRSLEIMFELRENDPRVKLLSFSRNFGHQPAVTAGLDHASGDSVVIIDADLQDPPEVILDLVAKWREGYDVVYAVRTERKGESWFKLFTAKLFYRLIYRITDVDIPLDTGDFRLMDRKVVETLDVMREHNRFIRGMVSWIGFKQAGVGYVRQERFAGETKYPLRKMIRFAWNAVTSFSYFPLQIMVYASGVLAILAVLILPIIVFGRLATGQEWFEGQATTIVLLLLLNAFQLFFSFILGQYVARIYDEVRGRPLYVVARRHGLSEAGKEEERVKDDG